MALNFPNPPTDGQEWEDPCNNWWVYDGKDNKWTLKPTVPDISVDTTSTFWRRDGTKISPAREGDDLDMATKPNQNIDFTNFPTKNA